MDDDTVKKLQEQVEALSKQVAEANKVLAPIQDEEIKLNAHIHQLREEFNKQITQINNRKKELSQEKYKAQSLVNELTNQQQLSQAAIKEHEQQLAKEKAEKERKEREAEQYRALEARFDQETIRAPWREWAKDHQIQAGHKITKDRYVILADQMGLGKTLSSIITADMAEKVTKACSPDFPFLGKEKEEFIPEYLAWTDKAVQAYNNKEWPFFNGPLENTINDSSSPFTDDPGIITINGKLFKAGSKPPYLAYDLKNKLKENGFLELLGGEYQVKITNAIERPVGRKVLYFCPSPLLRNVLEEWQSWAPHRNVTFVGNMPKAARKYALNFLKEQKIQDYVIIVNYEAWRRDKALLDELVTHGFDTVIIDEAHNIKDMNSQAYKGVHKVVTELNPEYIIPMTGTPVLNRPQELYSLLTLVNPEEFYSPQLYLSRYCEEYFPKDLDGNIDYNNPKWRFREGGLELLAKKIHVNFLQRTKADAGIILPEKTILYHELDRDDENYPKQAQARTQMKNYATVVIDEAKGKALQATVMIALITRLRQIETWPPGIIQYQTTINPKTLKKEVLRDPITNEKLIEFSLDEFDESQKLDYVIHYDQETKEWEGLIPDNVDNERLIVFSQFTKPLHELKSRIEKAGYKAAIIEGGMKEHDRTEIAHDFDIKHTPNRKDSKYDVLLCNYKAGGTGLNLTCATNMIILDSEWSSGKRDQAIDRIHRMGQTNNVTINIVTVKNTIDEWLENIVKDKEAIVGGFESAMQAVTASDLKDAIDSGLI